MPVDHSKHKFLQDIGTDWVALAANGAPLARAHDEETVRRAAPDAVEYVTGSGATVTETPSELAPIPTAAIEPAPAEPAPAEPAPAEPAPAEPVATGRRKRKPAE